MPSQSLRRNLGFVLHIRPYTVFLSISRNSRSGFAAQKAPVYNSKVHAAYAKKAEVKVPSLETWESSYLEKTVPFPMVKLPIGPVQIEPEKTALI